MNPYTPPVAVAESSVDARLASRATRALVLGAMSVFVCAPVLGPWAVVEAIRALSRGQTSAGTTRAVLGLCLAVLGGVLSAVLWLLAIWQVLQPGERHVPR